MDKENVACIPNGALSIHKVDKIGQTQKDKYFMFSLICGGLAELLKW
jgi:hypothetical protein